MNKPSFISMKKCYQLQNKGIKNKNLTLQPERVNFHLRIPGEFSQYLFNLFRSRALSPLAGLDFQNPRVHSHYSTVSGKNLVFSLICSWCESLPHFATFSETKTDFPSYSLLQHLATISLGSHIFGGDVSNNLDFSLLLLFLDNLWATLPRGQKAECEMVIPVWVSPSQNGLLSNLMAHVAKSIFSSHVIPSICHHLIL